VQAELEGVLGVAHPAVDRLDPHGYQWELSEPVAGDQPADSLEAARASWFDTPAASDGS
jgi:hypothetical protein